MKSTVLFAGLIGLALFFTGCAPATSPAPGGGSVNPLASPGKVIQNIDFGTVTLPASLVKAPAVTGARAVSWSSLDLPTLPVVKGSEYNNMVEGLTGRLQIEGMVDLLQTSDAVVNNTLVLNGTTADVGTATAVYGDGTHYSLPHSGSMTTKLSADGQRLECWWSLSYPNPGLINGEMTTEARQAIYSDTSKRVEVSLFLAIQKSGAVEVYDQSAAFGMKQHILFNPATRALVEATITNSGKSFRIIAPQADGSVQFVSDFVSPDPNNSTQRQLYAGSANDTAGGLVSYSRNNSAQAWTKAEVYGADSSLEAFYGSLDGANLSFASPTNAYVPIRALTLDAGYSFQTDGNSAYQVDQGGIAQPDVVSTQSAWKWDAANAVSAQVTVPVMTLPLPGYAHPSAGVTAVQTSLVAIWPSYFAKTIDDYLGADYTAKWNDLVPLFPVLPQ